MLPSNTHALARPALLHAQSIQHQRLTLAMWVLSLLRQASVRVTEGCLSWTASKMGVRDAEEGGGGGGEEMWPAIAEAWTEAVRRVGEAKEERERERREWQQLMAEGCVLSGQQRAMQAVRSRERCVSSSPPSPLQASSLLTLLFPHVSVLGARLPSLSSSLSPSPSAGPCT